MNYKQSKQGDVEGYIKVAEEESWVSALMKAAVSLILVGAILWLAYFIK